MPDAKQLFAETELITDDTVYTFIALPPRAITAAAGILAEIGEAFLVMLADEHEVSLIIPLDVWETYENRLPEARQQGKFRLITFNTVLEFEVTGYMAIVTDVLASAKIPVMAFSAFSRDHILVPSNLFQQAMDVLAATQKVS